MTVLRRGGTSGAEEMTDDDRFKLERVAFFSDAIFAIAATLLIIDLRLPEVVGRLTDGELLEALLELAPGYYGFLVSFVVIGLYWAAHHLTLGRFVRYDPALPYVNLPVLFCIAVLPFPTAVLGQYSYLPLAVILYAAWMALTGLAATGMYVWASRGRRLLPSDVSDAWIRERTWISLSVPLAFSISIPIAVVSPLIAQIAWWPLVALLNILVARRFEQSRVPAEAA
jgi:uncharacterized membrane protein